MLKHAGLVSCEAAGNCRIYRINPAGLGEFRAYLDQFWSRTLAAYKAPVGQHEEEVS